MIKIEYINANMMTKKEVADLEIWLADKEITEYNAWKKLEANVKDRTAMDKVIAELKKDDEEWLQKEESLRYMKILLSTQNNCLGYFERMLSMVTAGIITLEQFNAYQDELADKFN